MFRGHRARDTALPVSIGEIPVMNRLQEARSQDYIQLHLAISTFSNINVYAAELQQQDGERFSNMAGIVELLFNLTHTIEIICMYTV